MDRPLGRWQRPPKGVEALREILANARKYAQRPVGCGLVAGCPPRPDRHGHTVLTSTVEVW
jgi:hypothetical protein